MARHFEFDQNARSALQAGVDKLADAVAVTLGPRGRHVLLRRGEGPPAVTNDGVTVAREIVLVDARENLGATLLKEVANTTQARAGDGTTTAVVLARAMVDAGIRALVSGANPMLLKRGMDRACARIVRALVDSSRAASEGDLRRLGALSASGDEEIGRLLGEAAAWVGPSGVIQVEASPGIATELVMESGVRLDEGYLSPYFVTDPERLECVLEAPLLFICADAVIAAEELVPALERAAAAKQPLIVIADSLSDEVLSMLVTNRLRGTVIACAIAAPGYGERRRAALEDIAALAGATLVSSESGVGPRQVSLDDLGGLARAVITRDSALLTADETRSSELNSHLVGLRRERERAEGAPERSRLYERIARLESRFARLKVGALSEVLVRERTTRVEDAVAATRAALEEGLVIGGGVAYLRALGVLDGAALTDDEVLGRQVLFAALSAPAAQIAHNAGHDGATVVAGVLQHVGAEGFDAEEEEITDLEARGILDPTTVSRVALEQAVSISGMILTTDALITDDPNAEDGSDETT